jgi:replication factor C subunit 2/4
MSLLPLSDKYRPRSINDLILDSIIFNKIKDIVNNKNIPNIILTGKSGIGKTSTIHCIARSIYPKNFNDAIIELNASDDRGIKSVHDTIINFCKRKIEFREGYAQHKLLILDEADNITPKAQRLINSIMEKYPNTRFVFTCNNSSDIIESIQSRCIIIRFNKPPTNIFIEKIKIICQKENIDYDDDALEFILNICQKDLRKTLNMIELIHISKNKLSISNIREISDIPSENELEKLLINIKNKNITNISMIINNFKIQGYYSIDILLHLIQYIKNYKNIDIDFKINLINILSNEAYVMSKTVSNYLQLTGAIYKCV